MWQSEVTVPFAAIKDGLSRRRMGRLISVVRVTRNPGGAAVGMDDVLLRSVVAESKASGVAGLTQELRRW